MIWFSLLVLIPLAAICGDLREGLGRLLDTLTNPQTSGLRSR